jgi:5-formyltetrahydrofolate cyclo-ligase
VSESTNELRNRVRREVRAERRALGERERERRSHAVCRHFVRCGLLLRARRVACFWPNDGEADLTSLVQRLWRCGLELYLPVIARPRLWFAPFRPDTPLAENRFGIPEPSVTRRDACPLLALDVVLVPLVAFDERGQRVGMGGGYYDRTFAHLRHRRSLTRPYLVGTGFEFQRRKRLPAQHWDVPLDAALTDRGLQRFAAFR